LIIHALTDKLEASRIDMAIADILVELYLIVPVLLSYPFIAINSFV